MVCDYDGYSNGNFNAEYETVIKISKVANAFVLYHRFRVNNMDPDGLFPILETEPWEQFTLQQYDLEEKALKYLADKNVSQIETNEFDMVVTGIDMPENSLFGRQMTIGTALFHDAFGICDRE